MANGWEVPPPNEVALISLIQIFRAGHSAGNAAQILVAFVIFPQNLTKK